jgi:hypothetical protein
MTKNKDPLDYNPSFMKEQADLDNEHIKEEKEQFEQVIEQDKVTMLQALKTDQTHALIRDHIRKKQQEFYYMLIGSSPLKEHDTMESVRAVTAAYQYLLDLYDAFEAEGETALKKINSKVEINTTLNSITAGKTRKPKAKKYV